MTPLGLLVLLLAVLIAILVIDRVYRRRRARLISGIGAEFRMNYSPLDRFALTERLMTAPAWRLHASDLGVKDVLYASRGEERCFVLNAKCRPSLDSAASRFIVRIVEQADHSHRFELNFHPSARPSEDPTHYRNLLHGWQAEHDQKQTRG